MIVKLRYYRATMVEVLRDSVGERLDWYYNPQGGLPDPLVTALHATRESSLDAPNLAGQLTLPRDAQDGAPGHSDGDAPGEADAKSALHVFRELHALTPQQASDERLWTWLCHVECPEYVARRWLTKRPAKAEDATRKVRNHFFARDNRAFIRDNGLSRLWWLGFIAHEVEPEAPHAFLEILLHRQDVRSALIERPSVSMNRQVLRGIYTVMREYWEQDRVLFERGIWLPGD